MTTSLFAVFCLVFAPSSKTLPCVLGRLPPDAPVGCSHQALRVRFLWSRFSVQLTLHALCTVFL